MPVGLSDGTFHEDFTLMSADSVTKGLQRVVITKDDPTIDSTMPLGATEKPADALKSGEGSQVPENAPNTEIDWSKLNQTTGSATMLDVGDSPIAREMADFKRRASEPVGDVRNFTKEDFDNTLNVVTGAGAGILAGVKGLSALPGYAKGEMLTKLGHAQVLEGQAAHVDDVWQQTGFFRGADGRWKYEIPDKDAALKESGFHKNIIPNDPRVGGEENLTYSVKEGVKVKDILAHSRLFEAYPFLKDIKIVKHSDKKTIGQASLKDNTISFRDDLDPEYLRGVLLHELQHFVQANEGFAGGSGSQAFKHPKFDELLEQYEKAVAQGADVNSPQMKESRKVINESWDIAIEKYRRVMGEVEARNVQTRRDFNETKRHYNSPPSTEDRPRFVQIDPRHYSPTQSMQGPTAP